MSSLLSSEEEKSGRGVLLVRDEEGIGGIQLVCVCVDLSCFSRC